MANDFFTEYLAGNTIPTRYRTAAPQLDYDPRDRLWENERQRAGAYSFGELPPPIPEYTSDVSSGYVEYPQEAALAAAEQRLFTPDPVGETTVYTPAKKTTETKATKSTKRIPNVVYENGKPLPKESTNSFSAFLEQNPYAALSALALLIGGGALALRR